jgi:hypothetical protein
VINLVAQVNREAPTPKLSFRLAVEQQAVKAWGLVPEDNAMSDVCASKVASNREVSWWVVSEGVHHLLRCDSPDLCHRRHHVRVPADAAPEGLGEGAPSDPLAPLKSSQPSASRTFFFFELALHWMRFWSSSQANNLTFGGA